MKAAIFIIIYFAIIGLLMMIAKRIADGPHKWFYRNPYDRRCEKCGRHEVSYCRDLSSWSKSWWEAHSDGDGSCN